MPSHAPMCVWMFWTGNNPMSAVHRLCLASARKNAGVEVRLVTPGALTSLVPEGVHPAYEHLSLVHRADYLRCYCLHHYGGAYLDLDVVCLKSLAPLWRQLEDGDLWAVGYRGMSQGEVICNSAFGPFRARTPLTSAWYASVIEVLDAHLPALRRCSRKNAGRLNVRGDVPGYPLHWTQLLAETLNPAQQTYRTHISTQLPFVVLDVRPVGIWNDRFSEELLACSLIGVAYLEGRGKDASVLSSDEPLARALRLALGEGVVPQT